MLQQAQAVVSTLLGQMTLSPLPLRLQPVYWSKTHALQLYPAPDVMVLAEDSAAWSCSEEAAGVQAFNPGSFSLDGKFAFYRPAARILELSELS